MILSLFNNLKRSDIEVRQGLWNREKNRGLELKGKTIGILGYGFMGEAFAQRLQGFDVKVIAYDKYKKDFTSNTVEEVDEKRFFQECDILSIHLPLTQETNCLIDYNYLSKFEKPIYLVNTARGKNLITADLLKALDEELVLGACLDVLEFESISFEQLSEDSLPEDFRSIAKHEKVLLSPHVAGWTTESYFKLSDVLADKILAQF